MNRRRLIQIALATGCSVPAWLAAEPAAKPPLLSGTTLEGLPYDLQAERGKVVLVFFWSTDCAVCRDKMPELRLNYEAWRNKGFQLVAVNVDKSIAVLREYQAIVDRAVPAAQRFPLLWRGASGHRDSFGALTQTPTSFVLDRAHKVVNEIRGRIASGLWDDIAELVLS